MSQLEALVNNEADFLIKVRSDTPVQSIAKSIRYAIFEEHKMPIIRAIGASAVNQACKGIAIARGLVATSGYDLIVNIGFINVLDEDGSGGGRGRGPDGDEYTAMAFHLHWR